MQTPKVVSPSGAKQPAALHRWGGSNPHRGEFPRLWEKKTLAVLLIAWAA